MQYEIEDSVEESQNCTVEESVKNWERRGRFVSLGFTSVAVGGVDVEWITSQTRGDERRSSMIS